MPRLIVKMLLSILAASSLAACTVVPPRVDYVGARVEIGRPMPYVVAPPVYYTPPAPSYYPAPRPYGHYPGWRRGW